MQTLLNCHFLGFYSVLYCSSAKSPQIVVFWALSFLLIFIWSPEVTTLLTCLTAFPNQFYQFWDTIGHLHDDIISLQLPECFETSYCVQYFFFFCEESLVRDTNLKNKDYSEMHSGSCSQMTSSMQICSVKTYLGSLLCLLHKYYISILYVCMCSWFSYIRKYCIF